MKDIKFESGVLTVTDKKLAIYLVFSGNEAEKYKAVEKSLPRIKGLKRPMKRAEFAFDLISEMDNNGIDISLK